MLVVCTTFLQAFKQNLSPLGTQQALLEKQIMKYACFLMQHLVKASMGYVNKAHRHHSYQ